jgi:hypothetical protein
MTMGEVWFQHDGSSVRYDIDADAVSGGPWALSALWSGLPAEFQGGTDAAVNWGNGKAYLFRGDAYVRVDIATRTCETAAKTIAGNWPGMAEAGFGDGLQAAVNYGNGSAYFFKGDQFCTYDIAGDRVTGAVGTIASWKLAADGSFDGDLDAVINYGNGRLYFFKAGAYVRFDLATATVSGEIRSIAQFWTGMAAAGLVEDLRGSWCTADPAGTAAATGVPATTGAAAPDRRAQALALLAEYVPSDTGDAHFGEIAQDYTGGGTTCGFLCHWLMWRLGARDPAIVNRNDPANGLSYVDGRNMSMIYHNGEAPFVKAKGDLRPGPGDIILISEDPPNPVPKGHKFVEHVMVIVGSRQDDAGRTWWDTAEAGQTNQAGAQCARNKQRELKVTAGGRLLVSGNSPERFVNGWIDLDQLVLS